MSILIAQPSQAGFEPLIDFARHQAPKELQWRPGHGMPQAVRADEGIRFPCPFNAQSARFYWDYPLSVDLTKSATIELELFCPSHEAFQSSGLYLKSGRGWYLWIKPLVKSGRQRFFLHLKNASTEGRPAGWNKITGVRVSFQNNATLNSFMVLRGLRALTSGIVLVKGTSSAPNDVERSVAQKTTARLSKWLEDMDIAHSVVDDEEFAAGNARSAKILILPYNPKLNERQLRQMETLIAAGGKIIVFYGSDPRLAELMDMKLGKYQAAGESGRLSGFQFNSAAPPGIPPRIIQESGNIYTVFPKSGQSRIIAFWQDASGKLLSDPAWVQSKRGFWMTHILQGEDSENKKRMLLAMLGHYESGAWKEASLNALEQIEHLAGFNSLSDAITAIRTEALQSPRKTEICKLLDQATTRRAGLTSAWESGKYADAFFSAGKIRECILKALAINQQTGENEFRGVWNHSGLGLYPGNWHKTCQLLAQAGITAVFPNMLWPGTAHFPGKFVGQSKQSRKYGDQMAQCVEAARGAGLELHAWKVCWDLGKSPADFTESMRKQGRLQRNNRNETVLWLCPSVPANISIELNTIMELVNNYDIDGIHLDYIRYPDANSCYCAACRRGYEKWAGHSLARWPADVVTGKQSLKYKTWRSLQITDFVRTVRREMKKIKPQVKLSAAVYPRYPECAASIGQDWGLWLKEGTVDFVCPMNYLPTVSAFRETFARQSALQNSNRRLYPGIGATLSEGDLGNEIFLGQLRTLRERGAGGFMLFDLNPSLAANFLPLIGER